MSNDYPERIVCLTEETTETLYLLGEDWRIVGISGYTVRPPQARHEKPKVSAFTTARIEEIVRLEPDLVLGFSDLQGDIARDLVKRGIEVHIFNQRTLTGIFRMIRVLGAMIGCQEKAVRLVAELQSGLADVRAKSELLHARPRVYFEEWDAPQISGIGWVSELIHLAGGQDCFEELGCEPLATNRIIADPREVVRRRPEIIVGSWCGKKFRAETIAARDGWQEVPAVKNGHLYEIKSPIILQPGPAAVTDGVNELLRIFTNWDQLHRSS